MSQCFRAGSVQGQRSTEESFVEVRSDFVTKPPSNFDFRFATRESWGALADERMLCGSNRLFGRGVWVVGVSVGSEMSSITERSSKRLFQKPDEIGCRVTTKLPWLDSVNSFPPGLRPVHQNQNTDGDRIFFPWRANRLLTFFDFLPLLGNR